MLAKAICDAPHPARQKVCSLLHILKQQREYSLFVGECDLCKCMQILSMTLLEGPLVQATCTSASRPKILHRKQ